MLMEAAPPNLRVEPIEVLSDGVDGPLDPVELECGRSLSPGAAISDPPDADSPHQEEQHPEVGECLGRLVHDRDRSSRTKLDVKS